MAAEKYIHASHNIFYCIHVTGIRARETEADITAEKYIHASYNIFCCIHVTEITVRETEVDMTDPKYINASHNIYYIHAAGYRAREIEADMATACIAALRIYILYMQQDRGRCGGCKMHSCII